MIPQIGLCLWNPDLAQNEWNGELVNWARISPYGLLNQTETVYPQWTHFEISAGEDDSYLAVMGRLRKTSPTVSNEPLCKMLLQRLSAGEDLVTLLSDLEGEFGLAWWNGVNHTLTLACDPVGHLPLYYTSGEGGAAWSAFPQPLAILRNHVALNPVALQLFMELRGIPAPYCLIDGVQKVRPGWITVIGRETQRQRPYFNFDPPKIACENLASASNQLNELLQNSIMRQVAAGQGPVGIFLSGGLDSSLLLAIAKKMGIDIRAFSVGYQISTRTDETEIAASTAQHFNVPCEVVRVSAAEIVEAANAKTAWLAEPVADITIFPELLLAEQALNSVAFVLDGTGADGLFGGSEKYIADHYVEQWLKIPRLLRRQLLLPLLERLPSSRRWRLTNTLRKAKILAKGAELSALERLIYWSIFIPSEQNQRLLKGSAPDGPASPGAQYLQGLYPSTEPISLSQKSAATLQSSMPWVEMHKLQALEKLTGLSIGNPFLAPQTILFGLGLPDPYKVSGNQGKIVVRHLANSLVPEHILRRKKANFSPPITEWMNAELGEAVRSVVLSPHSMFDQKMLRRMIHQNQSGLADWRSEIWALYILQLWWDKTRSGCQDIYGIHPV